MSTRSRIGLQLSDGVSVLSEYHHWDGYPQGLGVILEEKFNTREKVAELVDGGDMSHCDSDKGWDFEELKPSRPQYYSERGEDCPPQMSETLTEYLDLAENTDGEYAYLFDGEWTCFEIGQYNDGVKGRILDIPPKEEVPVTTS